MRDGKLLPVAESGFLSDVHLVPALRINAIIVTAPEKTMKLIEQMIHELDTVAAATSLVQVFTLHRADAINTANLIRQLFTGQTAGGAGGGGGIGGGGLGGGGGLAGGGITQTRPILTAGGNIARGPRSSDFNLRSTTEPTRSSWPVRKPTST